MSDTPKGTGLRIPMEYGKILLIGFIVILSVALAARALVNRNNALDVVSVTGVGSKDFEADLAVSSGEFRRTDMSLQSAYQMLNADRKVIEALLKEKGVKESEVEFSSVNIEKQYQTVKEKDFEKTVFTGYALTQRVRVESKEVDRTEKVSRELTEIINKGIEFYSDAPEYYYTKLDEIKLEVIAAATRNAKLRAESIEENSGGSLGRLKNASLGVFQITGRNSDESYSSGGNFNTNSKKKTATITVRLQYAAE